MSPPTKGFLFYVLPSTGSDRPSGGLCWLTPGLPVSDTNPVPVPQLHTAPPAHATLNVVRDNLVPFLQPSHASGQRRWFVVWNSHAGVRVAERWLREIVLPMLAFAGVDCEVHESWQAGWEDGLWDAPQATVVVLGGDGTVSDLVNQLSRAGRVPPFELVVVPLGTANALFASTRPTLSSPAPLTALAGLCAALLADTQQADGLAEPPPRALPLARVCTRGPAGEQIASRLALVVASTALHAAILHTADTLRQEPGHASQGVEIFKEAFRHNATQTWHASLELLASSPESAVQRYSPATRTLVDAPAKETCMEDAFSYMTGCLVDRLESNFVIAPLRTPGVALATTMDVVAVRPMRDAQLAALDGDALAELLGRVMQGAYSEGAHIDMCTASGTSVVEYWRCGGWRWKPSDKSSAQRVCIDGMVVEIPPEGSVECLVLSDEDNKIRIY